MTPVFGHGHLRLYLLSLLDESPKHGYELIQALSDRFGGTYSPSAGTIYPRLAKLEEEGLVTKTADGRKTVYSITDAGRAEVESRRGELDEIEAQLSDSVRRIADEVRSGVNEAMKSLKADLASAAREARASAKESARSARSAGASGAGWSQTGGSDASGFPSRAESAEALRSADVALTDFRQAMRLDLRKASARSLDPAVVDRLKLRLDEVRAEFRDELRPR
ncbi:PadR family transcriptional regulator [Herbiconiux sp. KACC 21604]|uniref:PadR family transcriptional regulator n=1 Tax=unclassified Herbiconiux TaxID=2618217 RepID=UPI001490E040|nr:PadR family transcriptional regulator [Herbiconiux sp. SALV-R1]QJU54086.1 helix-turn-helix transcriptional regulator [Herbiconiux sp. SALV-R1]WPO85132.1 PadR family transcriptional regulator [Herbiconiux sp. KACC 21604]